MNQAECAKLGGFLATLLQSGTISIRRGGEDAEMFVGDVKVADVIRDDEDGEVSYCVSLSAPRAPGAKKDAPLDAGERVRLEAHLKAQLAAPKLEVRARPRKTDSAEVYVADEFIGTLSSDADAGYYLTMIVLGYDLEEE